MCETDKTGINKLLRNYKLITIKGEKNKKKNSVRLYYKVLNMRKNFNVLIV